MKAITKIFTVFTLFAILELTFVTPVTAFDGRSGDNLTIAADEVINDDLYVTAGKLSQRFPYAKREKINQ